MFLTDQITIWNLKRSQCHCFRRWWKVCVFWSTCLLKVATLANSLRPRIRLYLFHKPFWFSKMARIWICLCWRFTFLQAPAVPAALTRELSSLTFDEKFHIYARLCVILYICSINLCSFQRWREFACVEDIGFLQAPAFPRCSKFKSFYYIVTS